jgi:hypothetical protein
MPASVANRPHHRQEFAFGVRTSRIHDDGRIVLRQVADLKFKLGVFGNHIQRHAPMELADIHRGPCRLKALIAFAACG